MFDIGWTELLLIAVIAIVVVGPRDLPRLMRTVGQYTSKLKSMSRDLKAQFDEAIREAELDEVRTSLTDLKMPNPINEIRDTLTKPIAELKSAVSDAGKLPDTAAVPQPSAQAPEAQAPEAQAPEAQVPEAPAPEAQGPELTTAPVSEPEPKRVVSRP